MNILVGISGDYAGNYGGGQVYARSLVAGLCSVGHVVNVFGLAVRRGPKDRMEIKEFCSDGVTVREVCLSVPQPMEMAPPILEAVREAIKHFAPDVVHAQGWKAAVAQICQMENVPCVITAHHGGLVCPAGALLDANGNICQRRVGDHCVRCCQRQMPLGMLAGAAVHALPRRARLSLGRALEAIPFVPFVTGPLTVPVGLSRRLDAIETIVRSEAIVVAPSRAIQAALIRNGIPRERTEVVYHGIEPFEKHPLPIGLGSRPLRLAYVGRLNRVKGLHVLAEAIGLLRSPAAVELHLLGAAHTRSEKRYAGRVIRAVPEGSRVVDHGQLDRSGLARALAECDVLVLPSICLEVFGLVILEAFSLGRPVIVSKSGGPEEVVRDGIDGLVVERNDSKALARAIQLLIDAPSRIEAMVANVGPVRTMQDHATELEHVYSMAIERASAHPDVTLTSKR